MKIIFLDIDGVLNCTRTPNPRKFPYIVDQDLLKRFLRLRERTGAEVVLTSTWRYDPIGLLAAKHFKIPFIDVIPDMPEESRCTEITSWLAGQSVSRFVVLDDEDDELDGLPLFQPSATTGLTDEIARGVADYLDGGTDRDMRCNRVVRAVQNIGAMLKGHEGGVNMLDAFRTSRICFKRPQPGAHFLIAVDLFGRLQRCFGSEAAIMRR